MPVVPSAIAPSVAPTANAGIGFQNSNGATPDAFGAGIGEAQQRLGKEVNSISDILASNAEKMQADVNASAAKNLFLEGDVAIGKLTVEYNSLEGANKVNAYPKYVEDIGNLRKDMLTRAPNDVVAKAFDQDFARRVGYSIVDGARGAASATKQYNKETSNAVRANSLNHVAANAQDDQRFETELEIQRNNLRQEDDYKGSSPEVKTQRDQDFLDTNWTTRLQSLAKTDPLRAEKLLAKAPIGGLAREKLKDTVTQGIINVQSRVDSDSIVESGALVSDGLKGWLKKSEGYVDKAQWDFKQMSSGYGTKAQPDDETLSPDQRKAVYEQRFNTEVARAANTVDTFMPGLPKGKRDALIDLTYNAGSAWTSAGLGQAIKRGDDIAAQKAFSQYVNAGDKENPALVRRRYEGLDRWNSDNTSTDAEGLTTAKAFDRAKEIATLRFPNDEANRAKYLDTLQTRISSDMRVMTKEARDLQLGLKNTVQEELYRQDKPPTNYSELSPKAQQAYDAAPPQLQQNFQKGFRQNSTRDVPLTAEAQNKFDSLRGEAINAPDQFVSRDLTAEVDLPRTMRSQLLKMQQDRKALVDKGARMGSVMSVMQPFLNDLQIAKSASDPNKNGEYNKFSGVMEAAVTRFVTEKQRMPNEKEIKELGTPLLKDIVTGPGMLWGNRTERAYRVIADKTPVQVKTREEAMALPADTVFETPDGRKLVR